MIHFFRIILLLFLTEACFTSCRKDDLTISSPDGNLQLVFSLKQGEAFYALSRNDKDIVTPSKMGFAFLNMEDMDSHFKVIGVSKQTISNQWEQPWGESRFVDDNHTEMVVSLQEDGGQSRLLDLTFRLFNDGLGFRYFFPKQPNIDSLVIKDEKTSFTFADEHNVWWIPVHSENSYYESLFRRTSMGETDTINTPAVFETADGLFFALHEANLTDYASMTLRRTSNNQYISELVPWSNGVKVYAKAPFATPWRTLIVVESVGELATSKLMLNLNDPCAVQDVSWIKPSKYIGIWWGMHLKKYTWGQGPKHGATTENTMKYIDFASANGFDGVLVEGWNVGWDGDWSFDGNAFSFTQPYPDFDIEKVCQYAASKNVRLIGHHETGGAISNYERQMEDGFKLYQKNGVNTVKTGYVNKFLDGKEWHDGQYGVRHYRKVIEMAAKYHIMIDNHEPVKGTGLQRTYPNLMTQEGGRGQEYDAWSDDGGNPPDYTTILPFTRMLSGPFDFTPGTFNFDYQTVAGTRVQTTLAKQLALFVVLYSPLQMASDLPENYLGQPAFQFLKDVPCNWFTTKVLNAEIGKYTTIARKDWDSEDWYLGAITNKDARKLNIPLSFLDAGKKYKAEIYSDGKGADYKSNPYPVLISSKEVNNSGSLDFVLAPGGGAAVKLSPIKEE
ncbi:glycoside hydrolase family 97 protein [Geofilum sp. OHC36d9]|uniref:glycoside hydrolase family 97 protein n=1 Tax=Geofilum sp. OHC36d9 TaxID=3458413 RepID=UPI004034D5FD